MTRKASSRTTQFALHLLGAFRLEARAGDTTRLIHLPRRKVETLLAYLVLFPDSAGHAREKLAALFWGDKSDEQARTSLRTSLAVIRKTFGEDALIADRERAQINPDFPLWVDTREFLQARAAAPEHAIQLYDGDLLADFYDDWVLSERARLRALYIETLARLTQQMRSQSEYERALVFTQKILAADPAHEAAHQHAMFCQMARGDRAAALDQYDACVRALRDELAVEPSPETQGLYHWIKQTHLTASDAARITNLPIPLTSFVGRKPELNQIKALVSGSRLLTLTGTGGTGKTRLSIQVAIELLDTFRHGVWWVELAHLTAPALVPQTVAKALGVSEVARQTMTETLANFLRDKTVLLILDNCEHLIAACAELVESLLRREACPNLKILATSREPLNVLGESVWHVSSLSVPTDVPTREQLLLTYEGVRLFVERARAVKPGFALTEQNIYAVTQICRRLDGIPLAIELAAARVAVLSVEEIAARLDDRFNLLTHGSRTALPRQQTLRALVDWSYDLLAPDERILFQRLAVFSGGRTLSAIEQVCAFGVIEKKQALDLLARLVAKSLLVAVEQSGETRYGFLDTIKHYAREKLEQSDERQATRDQHLAYFLNLAEQAAPELLGLNQIEWLERLEREHANLRVALRHALESGAHEPALRLCANLVDFWGTRGYLNEGREWLRQALASSRAAFESTDAREFRASYAWALVKAGDLAIRQGDLASASAYAELGLAAFRGLADKPGITFALIILGNLARMQSDWGLARARCDEGLTLARELGNPRYIALTLRNQGVIAELQGDYARARSLLEDSLLFAQETGDQYAIALVSSNLGNIAQQQGDYAQARQLYEQVLTIHRQVGAKWSVAATLSNMGNVAHSEGDYVAARTFHEEALKMMRQVGDKRGTAIILTNLGNANLVQGDFTTARQLHEETLQLRHELGDKRGIAITYGNLGDVAVGQGNYAEAQKFYTEALRRLHQVGDKRTIANCLIGVEEVTLAQEQFARDVKLAGGIQALLAVLDAQIDTREQAIHARAKREARAHLDETTFDAAWAEGIALTMDQTIELAISDQS